MKSVLISIQPKWVEKIAKGEKTIEVRKTRPKLETPFKCYIYETKSKQVEHCDGCDVTYYGRGKVIGEFICEKISSWKDHEIHISNLSKLSCVSFSELGEYSKGGKDNLYGWHISDLKIYDKPKELSEFTVCKKCVGKQFNYCGTCKGTPITRPPQSWCYVESLGE